MRRCSVPRSAWESRTTTEGPAVCLSFRHAVFFENLFHAIDRNRVDRAAAARDRSRLQQRVVYGFLGRLEHGLEERRHSIEREDGAGSVGLALAVPHFGRARKGNREIAAA